MSDDDINPATIAMRDAAFAVANMMGERDTARLERDRYKAENERLRAQGQIAANAVEAAAKVVESMAAEIEQLRALVEAAATEAAALATETASRLMRGRAWNLAAWLRTEVTELDVSGDMGGNDAEEADAVRAGRAGDDHLVRRPDAVGQSPVDVERRVVGATPEDDDMGDAEGEAP